jgi:hypothetical protein
LKRGTMARSVLATAMTVLAAGCGQHFVPSYVPSEPPVLSSAPKVGVDLYITKNYSPAETMQMGQRDISYISRELGVGAIGISWDYEVPGPHSNTVEPSNSITPSIADIAALTAIAHSYDLQVEYRVLFQIGTQNCQSETLHPSDTGQWLASLLAAETPALRLAQQDNVREFVVGTELPGVEGSPLWSQFFSEAGQLYQGILSYAAWGGNPGQGGFFSTGRKLMPVTYYGVTAYPNVYLPPSASVRQLTQAWEKFLQIVPSSVLRLTSIDEVGIPAAVGAYRAPWAWNDVKGATDDQVQAQWFDAVCAAAGHEHMRAIYFWNANLIDNPADPFVSPVKFEARPASEAAIRNCQQVANVSAEEG